MKKSLFILLSFIIFFWLISGIAYSTTYYMRSDGIANKEGATSCAAANTSMNESIHNGETFSAGDVIELCDDGGSYSQLTVPSGGSPGAVITYQEASGDNVIIASAGYGFYLNGKSYIKIVNFTFSGGTYQIRAQASSNYLEVDSCTFGTAANRAIMVEDSDYPYVRDSTFNAQVAAVSEETERDTITFSNVDRGRIIANAFTDGGGHAFILIAYDSHYNVTYNNTGHITNHFTNPFSSLDLFYGAGDTATHNIAEKNTWTQDSGTVATGAVQITSSACSIYRGNIHNKTRGWMGNYCSTITHQYNPNYHNTYYDVNYQGSDGFWKYNDTSGYDNRYDQWVNNILHTWQNYAIHIYDWTGNHDNEFRKNAIYKPGVSTNQVRRYGVTMDLTGGSPSFEADYPSEASNNLITDPKLTNPGGGNMNLQPDSPCIDAAEALAYTNSSGSGTSMPVDNTYFFAGGFNIPGWDNDTVYVDNPTSADFSVKVVGKSDGTPGTLILASSQSWDANAKVYWCPQGICFSGSAPDIGALEYGSGSGGLSISDINSGNLPISDINSGNLSVTPNP